MMQSTNLTKIMNHLKDCDLDTIKSIFTAIIERDGPFSMSLLDREAYLDATFRYNVSSRLNTVAFETVTIGHQEKTYLVGWIFMTFKLQILDAVVEAAVKEKYSNKAKELKQYLDIVTQGYDEIQHNWDDEDLV